MLILLCEALCKFNSGHIRIEPLTAKNIYIKNKTFLFYLLGKMLCGVDQIDQTMSTVGVHHVKTLL